VVQTVALTVDSAATLKGPVKATATAGIAHTISLTSPNATSQADGLVVNVMPVASATSCGVRVSNQGKGTGTNIGVEIEGLPAGPSNYSFFDNSPAQNYFKGNVGINWTTPTANLEVSGTTKLRGTLEVTGNITSAGKAHSFAAGSIPAAAISGLPTGGGSATAVKNLTDVAITTPAVGDILRWNGTKWVNGKLSFSDLAGPQTNPAINVPSIFRVSDLAPGSAEAGKHCVVMAAPPVASATIMGVQGYVNGILPPYPLALILGKVNTATKMFVGGISSYSGWVSMPLGANERHACVFTNNVTNLTGNNYSIRFYTATESSNWSTEVMGSFTFN
jgi:hypothetical protein